MFENDEILFLKVLFVSQYVLKRPQPIHVKALIAKETLDIFSMQLSPDFLVRCNAVAEGGSGEQGLGFRAKKSNSELAA